MQMCSSFSLSGVLSVRGTDSQHHEAEAGSRPALDVQLVWGGSQPWIHSKLGVGVGGRNRENTSAWLQLSHAEEEKPSP